MIKKLLSQLKAPLWIGALQVQLTNSLLYVSVGNTMMLTLTFWHTAGYPIAQQYVPWLTLPMFLALAVLLVLSVVLLDYKFMLPTRQRFINEQACRHENPAMQEILKLRKDIDKIMEAMGVECELQ